ncbi:MAG: hypothetical protein JWN47_1074, partial [Frankiales bacterium]|nr:hypothetical protein [Frankiales bacterium]
RLDDTDPFGVEDGQFRRCIAELA